MSESQWSVVKMVKTNFIQELLQWGLRGLRFKYSMSKWGFISKDQGEGKWMKNYSEETSRVKGDPI